MAKNVFGLIGDAWNNPIPALGVGVAGYAITRGTGEVLENLDHAQAVEQAEDYQALMQAEQQLKADNLLKMLQAEQKGNLRMAELTAPYLAMNMAKNDFHNLARGI